MKYNSLYTYLAENFKLGVNSIHGPFHWKRVLYNGLEIAKRNTLIDTYVLELFSFIHDSKRENEYRDIEHGNRAAKSLRNLKSLKLINLTSSQQDRLHFACKYHTIKKTTTDPTIGACWDADRLELIRVGIIPSELYFSTEGGKEILKRRFSPILSLV